MPPRRQLIAWLSASRLATPRGLQASLPGFSISPSRSRAVTPSRSLKVEAPPCPCCRDDRWRGSDGADPAFSASWSHTSQRQAGHSLRPRSRGRSSAPSRWHPSYSDDWNRRDCSTTGTPGSSRPDRRRSWCPAAQCRRRWEPRRRSRCSWDRSSSSAEPPRIRSDRLRRNANRHAPGECRSGRRDWRWSLLQR